jgi:hypothetical protein
MAEDITTKHPEYLEMVEPWQTVRDTMKGEHNIKSKGETYLPMTSGQDALPAADGYARYDAYKSKARFFDLAAPAVRGLVGIAHDKPAYVEVPPRMEYIIEDATASGDTLDDLARKVTRESLQTGRTPLLVDAPTDGGLPYISLYAAESLINWKQDDMGYYLAVLMEPRQVADDEFSHEMANSYRVLRYDEFGYTVQVFVETNGELVLESEYAIELDAMPLSVAGAINTNASPDEPPILPISRSAVSAYQISADYKQSLYMTTQPTPCTRGLGDDKPTTIGADTVWHLPEGGDAFYMEVSGNGIALNKQAIDDELLRAEYHGSKLLQQGDQVHSAEALKLRMLSQYATLQSVVMSGGEAIEQALRSIAVWLKLNPDDVIYQPNTDFVSTVELNQMSVINQAVMAGTLPREILFEAARKAGYTKKTDEELTDMIEETEPTF